MNNEGRCRQCGRLGVLTRHIDRCLACTTRATEPKDIEAVLHDLGMEKLKRERVDWLLDSPDFELKRHLILLGWLDPISSTELIKENDRLKMFIRSIKDQCNGV